jgi:hypothetical protein
MTALILDASAAAAAARSVPPLVPFNLGSLGFLTPFDPASLEKVLHKTLRGERGSLQSTVSNGVLVQLWPFVTAAVAYAVFAHAAASCLACPAAGGFHHAAPQAALHRR